MLGAIVGSVCEFDDQRRKDFPLFREGSHFMGGTIPTIGKVEALMSNDPDFAAKYREYEKNTRPATATTS